MKESETAIWIHRTGTMQMKQQRATLEKRKAPKKRQKRECCGSTESPIVVARRSWSEISGGKLGTLIQQTKNSLNFVSTCLKVVDTRRDEICRSRSGVLVQIKHLKWKAAKLGFQIVQAPAAQQAGVCAESETLSTVVALMDSLAAVDECSCDLVRISGPVWVLQPDAETQLRSRLDPQLRGSELQT